MENRWSERTPLEISLMVYFAPVGLIRATSKDVSANGMSIDTGRIALASDETIEVTFVYPVSIEGVSLTLTAHVVYSSDNGSGVEFLNHTFEALDAINPSNQSSMKKTATY